MKKSGPLCMINKIVEYTTPIKKPSESVVESTRSETLGTFTVPKNA
jgi:hypothetical protein